MVNEGCPLPSDHSINTNGIMYPLTVEAVKNYKGRDGAANPFASTLLSASMVALAYALTL